LRVANPDDGLVDVAQHRIDAVQILERCPGFKPFPEEGHPLVLPDKGHDCADPDEQNRDESAHDPEMFPERRIGLRDIYFAHQEPRGIRDGAHIGDHRHAPVIQALRDPGLAQGCPGGGKIPLAYRETQGQGGIFLKSEFV